MPLNQPKISIIIPLYNKEQYIARCIESIQNQSFQDFEIILIDDCSSDKSIKIIHKMAETDNRIKCISHEKNLGTMKARETGYKNAKGEYIVFVDSDDTLPVDALEILHNEITKSGTDIVIGGFQYIGGKRSQNLKKQYPKVLGYFTSTEVFHLLLNHKLNHNLWSCIFNANLFNKDLVCYDHQTNGEDAILFYQLVGNSIKIKIINNITYNYHLEGESATRSVMTEDKLQQMIKAQKFILNLTSEFGIDKNEIIKNLASLYTSWNRYKIFRDFDYDFYDGLSENLRFPKILKYLPFKQSIILLLYKMGIRTVK